MKEKKFTFNINIPFLDVVGEYDVNLILFGLPIKSVGPLKSNISKYTAKLKTIPNLNIISQKIFYTCLLFDN